MSDIDMPGEHAARIEAGFSAGWVKNHPELFGKSVHKMLLKYPMDKWDFVMLPAIMPGHTWRIVATRKEQPE